MLCIGLIWQVLWQTICTKILCFFQHIELCGSVQNSLKMLFHCFISVSSRGKKFKSFLKGFMLSYFLFLLLYFSISIISEVGGANYWLISVKHIISKLQLLLRFPTLIIKLIILGQAFPISSCPFLYVESIVNQYISYLLMINTYLHFYNESSQTRIFNVICPKR